MRVLAFVDTHGSFEHLDNLKAKAKREKVDIVLCCGDITNFGIQQKRLMESIAGFEMPVLMIHGNHEDETSLLEDCKPYENIIFIHKAVHKVEGFCFLGYGGGGFATEDEKFLQFTKDALKEISKDDRIILLLHGPPHGTAVDFTMGSYVGNTDYTSFIENANVILAVCGHIHETAGREDRINAARIINPGPSGMIIDL
ncbi:MAG: metallophosphoesterase family protein [Nanoarchaeota archaeon]